MNPTTKRIPKPPGKVMFRKYLIEDAELNPVVSLVLISENNWMNHTIATVLTTKRRLIRNQLSR